MKQFIKDNWIVIVWMAIILLLPVYFVSNFLITKYKGNLGKIAKAETHRLREELLAINGVGPETCDSILLYAFNRRVFVVDAYTRRIFSRHGLFGLNSSYGSVQEAFTNNLPSDEKIFNEYHALLVRLAKNYCKTKPICDDCPLGGMKSKFWAINGCKRFKVII